MTKQLEERIINALKRWYEMKPSEFYTNVVREKHYLDKLYQLVSEENINATDEKN